jgi:hypothetical protein
VATTTPEYLPKEPTTTPVSYSGLMRGISLLKQRGGGTAINNIPDRGVLKSELEKFIVSEKQRLDKLNVPEEKQNLYLGLLQNSLADLSAGSTFPGGSAISSQKGLALDILPVPDIAVPAKPSEFNYANEPVIIKTLRGTAIKSAQGIGQNNNPAVLDNSVPQSNDASPVGLQMPADAVPSSTPENLSGAAAGLPLLTLDQESEDIPTLADVQQDGSEVVINSAIADLAASLDNNPVKIYNFVRSSIEYEPYFGAKKGALGCLAERLCNDTDASSLTIALLRAAGIPARYKKDLVVMSADQLKNLLGVDETKTAYAALFWNKVPVYLISSGSSTPPDFDTYDFSSVTQLALEWTYAEAFYEYDDRGGNVPNVLGFSTASSTEQVQSVLAPFPKKQWIPLDTVVKPYGRSENEIVPDTVSFNTQNFWTNFLSDQSGQNPLQKYTADLLSQSGKNIATSTYQSFRLPIADELQILPPTLPYLLGTSPDFTTETWSAVPDSRKEEVTVTLKKDSNQNVILQQKFFGSQINNMPFNLSYRGATVDDQAIIDSYGGIPATPAALVDIAPYFSSLDNATTTPIKIGESLVLQFDYGMNGQVWHTDQKFSTAGNQEGIYVSLSKPLGDPLVDSDPGKILLEGNSALARNYLKRISDNFDSYKKALDVSLNTRFSRAVVTQNRVLNTVNGLPTTFDFNGLTLDASTYITNYSNRGNYKNHDKDLHLLMGLDASYHEGQIFNDIAGLDGISTVKGLQFAAAHPADYTIYTITQTNESQIDSLQLSANTKQNMHADVQNGKTIITPNKLITNGQWNGILYISLSPDGTGTYAIGEQAQQNGGFTTNNYGISYVLDLDTGISQSRYYNDDSVREFVYADRLTNQSYRCSILKSNYDTILNMPGYESKYGLPCYVGTKIFGSKTHTYYLLTDGVRFVSPGNYDTWKSESLIHAVLQADKNNDNLENLKNIYLNDDSFGFDSYSGTYSEVGLYNGSDPLISFYQPDSIGRGYGRIVFGDILSKLFDRSYTGVSFLCADNGQKCVSSGIFTILNKLGFPTGNEGVAAKSPYSSEGYYQHFFGGDVYRKKKKVFFGMFTDYDTFYVPIQMFQKYQGTGTEYGFPQEDPILEFSSQTLSQKFEGKTVFAVFDNFSETSTTYTYTFDTSDTSGAFIEGIMDAGAELGMTGILVAAVPVSEEQISKLATEVITKVVTKQLGEKVAAEVAAEFVSGIGWVIIVGGAVYGVAQISSLISACSSGGFTDGMPAKYYCGKLVVYLPLALLVAGGYAVTKLNLLGVDSSAARAGMLKVESSLDDANSSKVLGVLEKKPLGRDLFTERVERLNLKQQDILSIYNTAGNLDLQMTPEFHQFEAIKDANIRSLDLATNKNLFAQDGPPHIITGGYHFSTGLYEGEGLHSPRIARSALENGIIKFAADPAGQEIYTNFDQIPKYSNGVRKVYMLTKSGNWLPKTLFPDSFTDQDILDAIAKASKVPNFLTTSATVNQNGVSIPIIGGFANGLIVSGYPYYPN